MKASTLRTFLNNVNGDTEVFLAFEQSDGTYAEDVEEVVMLYNKNRIYLVSKITLKVDIGLKIHSHSNGDPAKAKK